jgi:hypothetical protein
MNDRFKRPVTADQINQTLEMLLRATQKFGSDPEIGDLLHKARHLIQLLWRECSLHENLEQTAAETLNTVEKRLADCLEQQALTEAARALAEVNKLQAIIGDPPDTFKTWRDSH